MVSWEPVTREGQLLLVSLDIQLFEKGVKVRGHHDVVRSQSVHRQVARGGGMPPPFTPNEEIGPVGFLGVLVTVLML